MTSNQKEWIQYSTAMLMIVSGVVLAHLYMVALVGALLLAGWLEGGAL